jgi:hypothetical protein
VLESGVISYSIEHEEDSRVIKMRQQQPTVWESLFAQEVAELWEMKECCGCYVSPNGLLEARINRDLTANPFSGPPPMVTSSWSQPLLVDSL